MTDFALPDAKRVRRSELGLGFSSSSSSSSSPEPSSPIAPESKSEFESAPAPSAPAPLSSTSTSTPKPASEAKDSDNTNNQNDPDASDEPSKSEEEEASDIPDSNGATDATPRMRPDWSDRARVSNRASLAAYRRFWAKQAAERKDGEKEKIQDEVGRGVRSDGPDKKRESVDSEMDEERDVHVSRGSGDTMGDEQMDTNHAAREGNGVKEEEQDAYAFRLFAAPHTSNPSNTASHPSAVSTTAPGLAPTNTTPSAPRIQLVDNEADSYALYAHIPRTIAPRLLREKRSGRDTAVLRQELKTKGLVLSGESVRRLASAYCPGLRRGKVLEGRDTNAGVEILIGEGETVRRRKCRKSKKDRVKARKVAEIRRANEVERTRVDEERKEKEKEKEEYLKEKKRVENRRKQIKKREKQRVKKAEEQGGDGGMDIDVAVNEGRAGVGGEDEQHSYRGQESGA